MEEIVEAADESSIHRLEVVLAVH